MQTPPSDHTDAHAPEKSTPHGRTAATQYDFMVVSNRLPVDRCDPEDPGCEDGWRRSPGGLVTALAPMMTKTDGAWVGWHGAPDETLKPFSHGGIDLVPVHLSTEDIELFYEGFSNATLWPLYHDVIAPPEFHRTWWESYRKVNRRFADASSTTHTGAPRSGCRTTSSSSSPKCSVKRAPI
ncbi:trehalose-phosphate synthase [Arthrobacter sp. Hiyo6]|nr:trehalose-phosphate synthase [Arthrobacter sp. Hiyo6]